MHFVSAYLDVYYPQPWSPQQLKGFAIVTRLETHDKRLVGFIWGNFLPDAPDTINFHICIHPSWRGRWMDRRAIHDLFVLSRVCGAERVRGWLPPGREGQLFARLAPRYGFVIEGDYIVRRIDHGWSVHSGPGPADSGSEAQARRTDGPEGHSGSESDGRGSTPSA